MLHIHYYQLSVKRDLPWWKALFIVNSWIIPEQQYSKRNSGWWLTCIFRLKSFNFLGSQFQCFLKSCVFTIYPAEFRKRLYYLWNKYFLQNGKSNEKKISWLKHIYYFYKLKLGLPKRIEKKMKTENRWVFSLTRYYTYIITFLACNFFKEKKSTIFL